ncbi:hypothetical protein AcW1_003813 [Taiwanofungus camphoratus]|nr:hypothetical protein AcV5_002221 [Antrodia cinnamomea]KAI0937733.1 hypothetical protein AcW1_003813 [Antrodia cinnamomea]KAI0944090.1 hypothetical protein AcV7_002008 [Antrodia cinnamomea]
MSSYNTSANSRRSRNTHHDIPIREHDSKERRSSTYNSLTYVPSPLNPNRAPSSVPRKPNPYAHAPLPSILTDDDDFLNPILIKEADEDEGEEDDKENADGYTLSAYGDISLTEEYRVPSCSTTRPSLRPKVRRPPLPRRGRGSSSGVKREEFEGAYSRTLFASHLRNTSDTQTPAPEDFQTLFRALQAYRDASRRDRSFTDSSSYHNNTSLLK